MRTLCILVGMAVFGWVGSWLGNMIGFTTGFVVGGIGSMDSRAAAPASIAWSGSIAASSP